MLTYELLTSTAFAVLLVILDVTIALIMQVIGLKYILKRNPHFFYEKED